MSALFQLWHNMKKSQPERKKKPMGMIIFTYPVIVFL